MRKMPSRGIGVPVAGSRRPTASNQATLPPRATRSTAPGILPAVTSAFSTSVIICSRSLDSPTRSGVVVGSDCAAASNGPAKKRPATMWHRYRLNGFVILVSSLWMGFVRVVCAAFASPALLRYTQRAPSTSMQTPLMKDASSLAR
jgi:hypothetical protein